ncbi:MAG: DUF3108 domain-containing protein [Cyclobacteriaceae bacterium]|nr:DUF3108 domain-containing protein [Cyclobacteriaceae bacterium]
MKPLTSKLFILFFLNASWVFGQPMEEDSVFTYLPKDEFKRGEYLDYKATFGFFTVGKGTFQVQNTLHSINDRICYKVDAYGKTSGIIDWLASVDDHWGAYVDTSSLVTHVAYRTLREGRYKKNEVAYFDFNQDSIRVKDFDFEAGKYKEPKSYSMNDVTRDMFSGFLWMRTLDFSKLNKGDTITISSFLEDTFYNFKVVMYGREVLKTKAGKFKSIKFIPVMPDNSIFEGEDSIVAWFSDDGNKIPLKVEAKMFIGHAGIELTGYQNLSRPPGLVY